MRDGVLGAIPYPLRVIVGLLAYRSAMQTMLGQGTARYSIEEIGALKQEGWSDLNAVLEGIRRRDAESDKVFWVLGGQSPTELDTTLYGFIASALVCNAYVFSQIHSGS